MQAKEKANWPCTLLTWVDRELQSGQSNGYFSTMRINLHWLCAAWSVAMTALCAAQDGAIRAENFQDNLVHVSGQGAEIPGLDLRKVLTPKHWIGDDTVFAARAFDDTKWNALQKTEDSVVAGARVHWVRFHVLPDADLGSLPLTLDISTTAAVSAFLNGRSIVHAPVMPGKSSGVPLGDTLPTVSAAIRFAMDGKREVLAIRLEGPEGEPLDRSGLAVELRRTDSAYEAQRLTMHYGLFVGVNLVILVLALILWYQDRRERSWLLLALLSVIQAFDALASVAGNPGLLGFHDPWPRVLEAVSDTLMLWPFYLLIRVLGDLHGELSLRNVRRYQWAVWYGTLLLALINFGWFMGDAWLASLLLDANDKALDVGIDTTEGFTVSSPTPRIVAFLVVGILLVIPLVLVVAWFTVDVVRLGIRLLRSKGYQRWVGGGALVSVLLTLVFGILAGTSLPGAEWYERLGRYCGHIAVPMAVAIYLAVRSAHHSKAVTRQRDDLDREVHERTAELRAEKKRSDDLLLNILPEEVAEELKRTGAAEARHFEQATVMFTDFKGFTAISEKLTAAQLVEELNACFQAFDHIITARGIEKIKTIGDAYMCAGGLPDPKSSSPASVVHAALEMQAFMQQRKTERDAVRLPAFEMRVGIHTGPVVAGIVGVKKFQYDIWGDTVNTASRMESSGEVGQVNISEATYALVKDASTPLGTGSALSFTPRGKVHAKGKGEMEMYFVRRNVEVA